METVNCAWKPSCNTEEGTTSLPELWLQLPSLRVEGKDPDQDSDKCKINLLHVNLTTASGWQRRQWHAIMELSVSAKQYRAVYECQYFINELWETITLISPFFTSQGWNFSGTNHKNRLSPHTAKGGGCSQRQPDFASSSPPIFWFMPHHSCRELLMIFLWLDFQGLQSSVLSGMLVVTGTMCQRNYEKH